MLKGQFYFDPDDTIYKFHFPSCPVVPGSLIVEGFLKAVWQLDSHRPKIRVKEFRYQVFVTPGIYEYQVDRKSNRYHCRLLHGDNIMARGVICSET